MTEFKFPKIVALIQRRDRSQWEIGEELLRICGAAADRLNRTGATPGGCSSD